MLLAIADDSRWSSKKGEGMEEQDPRDTDKGISLLSADLACWDKHSNIGSAPPACYVSSLEVAVPMGKRSPMFHIPIS